MPNPTITYENGMKVNTYLNGYVTRHSIEDIEKLILRKTQEKEKIENEILGLNEDLVKMNATVEIVE